MADDEESRPLTSNGRESSGNNNGRNTRNGNITPSAEYGTVSSRHSSSDVGSASGGNNGGNGAHRLTDDNVYDEPGRKELPSNNTAGGDVVAAALEAVEKDPDANIHNPLLYLATDDVAAFNPCELPRAVHSAAAASGNAKEGERIAPLARDDSNSSGAFALTFRGKSPKFIRFGVLLLITLLPFGAHFVKSCFSSLETYFLVDPNLHFNETKYGSLMSAISVPNLFMPFVGGLFLDAKGHKQGIRLFLTIELIGHVLFTLAMGWDNFWLAIAGEILHGMGSGTVMVAMRAVVSKFFLENELTFALGVTVAGACVSKTLAKASVAPIAETRWGYMGALWYVGLWQVLSLIAGLVYIRLEKSAHVRAGVHLTEDHDHTEVGHKHLRFQSFWEALRRSTLSFWLVAILHTLFLTAYHLFSNYSGHFLFENYDVSPVLAGYISALMPLVVVFCAPIAGLFLDQWGRQLYVLLVANVFTIIAYVLLLREEAGAVVCIVMLALCESFVPTILLSALPLTVHPNVYGAAFGMAEVLSAISSIVSNVFFGYSRDTTASYRQDLYALVVLCFLCLAITLLLVFWDGRHGEPILNRPGRAFRERAERKAEAAQSDFKATHVTEG